VVDAGFDWDGYAADLGLWERRAHIQAQNDEARRARVTDRHRSGEINARQALDQFARIASRRAERTKLSNGRHPTVERRNIDYRTGEIRPAAAPTPVGAKPAHCRACGRLTTSREQSNGLPWCHGCLIPEWLARIERASGHHIPQHLIKPKPGPDWGEFGPPNQTSNRKELSDMDHESRALGLAA
jgi:hypothetical protein